MSKLIIGALILAGLLIGTVQSVRYISLSTKPAVGISLRGLRTNDTGMVCRVVAVTNATKKQYLFGFVTETKPAGGWSELSRFLAFKGTDSAPVIPFSEREFLVPTITSPLPWRVTAGYIESLPANYSKWMLYARVKPGNLAGACFSNPGDGANNCSSGFD